MADNITLNSGTGGDTLAADDVAGVKYPIGKVAFGALDSATIVSTADGLPIQGEGTAGTPAGGVVSIQGVASGTAVPVSVATIPSHAVTNAGTFVVQVDGSALTALQLIDDAVSGAGFNITQLNGVNVTMGNGISGTGVLRVTLASDSTGQVTLAAGTASIGKLAANSGVDIGDVDVTSIAAGDNNIGNVDIVTVPAPLSTTGGGTEATALRVTLASDSTGLVSVDDNGGSLTIDNAQLSVVGSGTEAAAMRVTIATDSTGVLSVDDNGGSLTVDNGGTFAVQAAQSGTWTVQPGNTANTTAWLVTDVPATSGGLSKFHLVGAATDNATNVKASAGQVFCITAFNLNASPRYLKFHNTAGTPTAGSGVTDTFLIPGNTAGAGLVINIDKGIAFGTGIGITIVTGIADNNTTAIGASEVVINVYYK